MIEWLREEIYRWIVVGPRIQIKRYLRRLNLCRRFRERRAEILYGHRWEEAESSPSGKRGVRCVCCGRYSNAPVKAVYEKCPAKKKIIFMDDRRKGKRDVV